MGDTDIVPLARLAQRSRMLQLGLQFGVLIALSMVASTAAALEPIVLADVYAFDFQNEEGSAAKPCSGEPMPVGSCISADDTDPDAEKKVFLDRLTNAGQKKSDKYLNELLMCDKDGQLLIADCVDEDCKKCHNTRVDNSYGSPTNATAKCCDQPLHEIFCKNDFFKVKCTNYPVENQLHAPDWTPLPPPKNAPPKPPKNEEDEEDKLLDETSFAGGSKDEEQEDPNENDEL